MTGDKIPLKSVVSLDAMMRTLMSFVLMITMALAGWSLVEVVDLKERVTRVETQTQGQHEMLVEIRSDLKEIRRLLTMKQK